MDFQQPYAATDMRSPPKQFSFSIAAGAAEKVFYNCNYLRILSLSSATGVTIRFGDSGTPTDLVGAGVGYELNEIVGNVTITNNSGAPITITIALAIGRIYDDRLNVSGTVNVASVSPFKVQSDNNVIQNNGTVSLPSGTSSAIISGAAGQTGGIIQNTGTMDMFIGSSSSAATLLANGLKLIPGAVFSFDGTFIVRGTVAAGTGEAKYWRLGSV